MDIIKSIKSWKPRNGFHRKSKSLQHGQQQQNLQTMRCMNDVVGEITHNDDEHILNNKILDPSTTLQPEWVNHLSSVNTDTPLAMREDMTSGSLSSAMTNGSSRSSCTMPNANQSSPFISAANNLGKNVIRIEI